MIRKQIQIKCKQYPVGLWFKKKKKSNVNKVEELCLRFQKSGVSWPMRGSMQEGHGSPSTAFSCWGWVTKFSPHTTGIPDAFQHSGERLWRASIHSESQRSLAPEISIVAGASERYARCGLAGFLFLSSVQPAIHTVLPLTAVCSNQQTHTPLRLKRSVPSGK